MSDEASGNPMRTKAKGTIHRGSTTHQILAELERYPGSWYQWHQFPHLEATESTIRRAMQRLIEFNKVEHQLVISDNEYRGRRKVVELRWKEAS